MSDDPFTKALRQIEQQDALLRRLGEPDAFVQRLEQERARQDAFLRQAEAMYRQVDPFRETYATLQRVTEERERQQSTLQSVLQPVDYGRQLESIARAAQEAQERFDTRATDVRPPKPSGRQACWPAMIDGPMTQRRSATWRSVTHRTKLRGRLLCRSD